MAKKYQFCLLEAMKMALENDRKGKREEVIGEGERESGRDREREGCERPGERWRDREKKEVKKVVKIGCQFT